MLIDIKDLSFKYGEKEVLKHLNLRVRKGERLCIKAPSGFGKTTLLRIICGLEKPTDGSIETAPDTKISVAFQEDRLLPWLSVKKNIMFVLSKYSKEDAEAIARKFLAAVDLEDAADAMPASLSGGMARRAALARALAADWDLLLLDEPFSGIDYSKKEQIAAFMREQFDSRTVILVSHDPEDARLLSAETIELDALAIK